MTTKKLDLGFPVTQRERAAIEAAMAAYAGAWVRVPKLKFENWREIAIACSIASAHIRKGTDGQTRTPAYTRPMSAFLKATGFAALNPDDLATAMRMLPRWSEIDTWRLTYARRANNPRQVLEAYTVSAEIGHE